MRIIQPYYEILDELNRDQILQKLELIGRVCYKSEAKIAQGTAEQFVKRLIDKGHEAIIEHYSFSVRFVCDRGVSHEIVRHRLASYAQESTRYCNYNTKGEITVIAPPWIGLILNRYTLDWEGDNTLPSVVPSLITKSAATKQWIHAMLMAEHSYMNLIAMGESPQQARSVLPNSLKTEIVMTANLREWRHFLKLRTASTAHPQMRELTLPLLEDLKKILPEVFGDII